MDRDTLIFLLAEEDLNTTEVHATMNKWLARGDGVAVYRNEDLGHPDIGHHQFVSYGSAQAQLETDIPPHQMPDIGNKINWRYQLLGTYRGEAL